MRHALLALSALVVLTLPGCKHKEAAQQAAHDQGTDMAKALTQPIDRARAATGAVEDQAPALVDPATNLYHTTTCRAADASMETTTVAVAKSRGAKPDPVCHPRAAE